MNRLICSRCAVISRGIDGHCSHIAPMVAVLERLSTWAHDTNCDTNDPIIKTKPCNCYVGPSEEALRLAGLSPEQQTKGQR